MQKQKTSFSKICALMAPYILKPKSYYTKPKLAVLGQRIDSATPFCCDP